MNHIDLFTGLGGFSLAAQAHGFRTEVMVEKDERCRAFLGRTWPGVAIHDDVRTFDGRRYRGATLLTAGVPCQPASRAGKQRGKDDDRWLWPETLRIVSEGRFTWCLFENPPGIEDLFEYGISLEVDGEGNATGEVGTVVDRMGRSIFCETLEAIEALGYEIQILNIPACAVNSPQLRHRYWIVAHAKEQGHERKKSTRRAFPGGCSPERGGVLDNADTGWGRQGEPVCSGRASVAVSTENRNVADPERLPGGAKYVGKQGRGRIAGAANHAINGTDCQGDLADAEAGTIGPGLCEAEPDNGGGEQTGGRRSGDVSGGLWGGYIWLPCADGRFRRAPDDAFGLVDGLHRSVLAALGNSIVWKVAAEVIGAIKAAEMSRG